MATEEAGIGAGRLAGGRRQRAGLRNEANFGGRRFRSGREWSGLRRPDRGVRRGRGRPPSWFRNEANSSVRGWGFSGLAGLNGGAFELELLQFLTGEDAIALDVTLAALEAEEDRGATIPGAAEFAAGHGCGVT